MKRIFTLFTTIALFSFSARAQTQASAITFEAVSQSATAPTTLSLKLAWTNGTSTTGRLVVIRDASGTFTPVNGTDITTLGANSDFSVATDKDAGAGVAKIVAAINGATSNVTVSNLAFNTQYFVQIYEFTNTAASPTYLLASTATNPKGFIGYDATANGTTFNMPANVISVLAQAWGGGGGGGKEASSNGFPGGGGGAYADGLVTSAQVVTIGTGGTGGTTAATGTAGNNTSFGSVVVAAGGSIQNAGSTGAAGGAAASSTGTNKFSGGNGGNGGTSTGNGGGGGGSSAGPSGGAVNGSNFSGGTGGAGGNGPDGDGGNGGDANTSNARNGTFPGGGGGGRGDSGGNSGNGANGLLVVSYNAAPPIISAAALTGPGPTTGTAIIGTDIYVLVTANKTGLSCGTCTINGQAPTTFTDNTDNTYTLKYHVASGNTDRSSGTMPISIVLTDGTNSTAAFTSITANTLAIDANAPVIVSVTSNATAAGVLKIGQTIIFTADIQTTEAGLTLAPTTYNGGTLTWSTSNSGDTYTATYTVISGQTDQSSPLQLTNVTATDAAGNTSGTVSGADVAKTIDANAPVVVSVTSDATAAGVLKIGQTIVFTADIQTTEAGLTIAPTTYNGGTLTWSTSNSGDTYTATYTVLSGQTDQGTALQLANVTATDAAGNSSGAVSGSDVVKTIDANAPSGYSVTIDQSFINNANKAAISFTFAGAEVGATYNYAFTDVGNAHTVSASGTIATATDQITGIDLTSLNDGTVTLTVTLTDPAGNAGANATNTKTKDVIPPTAPTVPDLASGSDSGISNSDDITKTTAVTFNSTSNIADNIGATIKIYSGATQIGSGAANGSGGFGVSATMINPNTGSQSITATATDAAGNVSLSSPSLGVTYDTQAPTISGTPQYFANGSSVETIVISFSETIGLANSSTISTTSSKGFSDSEGHYGSAVYTTASNIVTMTSSSNNQWHTSGTITYTNSGGIGGTWVVDVAGNEMATASNVAISSGSAPQISASMVLFPNGSSPETIVFQMDQDLSLSNGASVTGLTVNGVAPASAIYTGKGTGTATITMTSASNGMWTGASTVSYAPGNIQGTTAIATAAFGPEAIILTPVSIASNNASTSWAKSGNTVTVTFTLNKNLTAAPTAKIDGATASIVKVSGTANTTGAVYTASTSTLTNEGVLSWDITLTEANRVTDVTATLDGSAVTFDQTQPTVTPITIASNNANTAYAKVGDVVTVNYTATDNLGTITITPATIDGFTASTITATAATLTTTSSDNNGVVPFSITFTDQAGNSIVKTATTNASTVTFDKTPPVAASIAYSSTLKGIGTTNGIVATSVNFLVTFTETNLPLSGIDPTDFTVSTTGTVNYTAPLVVTGSGNTRTVTVNGITGTGEISLGLTDNNSILDAAGNPLDGSSDGSIATSFTGAQYYSIVLPAPNPQTINITTSNITGNAVTLSWSSANQAPLQNPTHFLVLANPGGAPTAPTDGTYVNDGTLAQNLPWVSGTNTWTFTGLNSGTSYSFSVYEYTLAPNTSDDNIDFETTSFGSASGTTTTASVSWMALMGPTAASINSTSTSQGTGISVMQFRIYDDGVNPISPNVMNLNLGGLYPEKITFTLTEGLTLADGASVTGFSSSAGTIASAIYNASTTSITLTSAADAQWTSSTTISYNASTGNAQFATLGKMQSIQNHSVVQQIQNKQQYNSATSTTFNVPAGVTEMQVEVWGAGGAGGGSTGGVGGGSGGGGGGYSRYYKSVTPTTGLTIVVGAGGNADPSFGYGGGGNTSYVYDPTYGYLGYAYGGSGGGPSSSGTAPGSAGYGYPFGYSGLYLYTGGQGGGGINASGYSGAGGGSSAGNSSNGIGGGSYLFCTGCSSPGGAAVPGGGAGGAGWQGAGGVNGSFPGGGGGGSGLNGALAGSGADGRVVITYSSPSVATGTTDWAGDNSPFKFSGLIITPGPNNSSALNNNWQKVIAGVELSDGTNTVSSVTDPTKVTINSSNITFTNLPSTTSADIGYVADATTGVSFKTYTLKVWLRTDITSALGGNVDNLILDFKLDATIAANLSYDDVTNSNQKSSRLSSPEPSFNSGSTPIRVDASGLAFTTEPGPTSQLYLKNFTTIPQVKALDQFGNLDLDYNSVTSVTNAGSIPMVSTPSRTSFSSITASSGVITFPSDFQYNLAAPGADGTLSLSGSYINSLGNLTAISTSTGSGSSLVPCSAITLDYSNSSTITNPTGTARILSTNTASPGVTAFTFKFNEDALSAGTDGSPTTVTQIQIVPDATNQLNWANVIAGATLTDGTQTISAASILASGITFNVSSSSLGTISDNTTKTYTLNIWFTTTAGGGIAAPADQQNLVFSVAPSNFAISTNSSKAPAATAITSGNVMFEVDAKYLVFSSDFSGALSAPPIPTPAGSPAPHSAINFLVNTTTAAQSFSNPVVAAVDQYGNLDTNYSPSGVSFSVTSAGSIVLSNALTSLTNGIGTFPSNFSYTTTGNGTLTVSSSTANRVGGVVSATSNGQTVTVKTGTASIIKTTSTVVAPSISSITNTSSGTTVFTFRLDDDPSPATPVLQDDGNPTLVNKIVITAASANNTISDWTQVIAGARLEDASNSASFVDLVPTTDIGTNTLTFNSIPASVLGDLGYIKDGTSSTPSTKTYNLKIWLKTNLSGSQNYNATIDGLKFGFELISDNVFTNAAGTSLISGLYANAPTNAATTVDVKATQLDFTNPNAATNASISVSYQPNGSPVQVYADDANHNVDLDFVGIIRALTNVPSATMLGTGGATIGTSGSGIQFGTTAFTSGSFTFPSAFEFTTGTNGQDVALTLTAGASGACNGTTILCGTTPTIKLITSFESSLVGDPTFPPFAKPIQTIPSIDYVKYQESTNIQGGNASTGTSYELIRALLVDGSRSSSYLYNNGTNSATLSTTTDSGDGLPNDDSDGGSTDLTSITLRIYKPSTLRRVALYGNGVEIPGTEIDVTSIGAITNTTTYYDFTWSQAASTATNNILLSAADHTEAVLGVWVSFRNTSPELNDQDNIQVDLIAATLGSGSQFYSGLGPDVVNNPGPYIGGETHNGGPGSVGIVDVIATSLDFVDGNNGNAVSQPSSFAGLTPSPVGLDPLIPQTTAGKVTARDTYGLIDTNFKTDVGGIVLTDGNSQPITPPTPFTFLNGVIDLKGMLYTATGNGRVRVQTTNSLATGSIPVSLDSENPINNVNNKSVKSGPVQVINTLVSYNASLTSNLSVSATGQANLKGGKQGLGIFGLTFTASGNTTSEPVLKKFTIGFKTGQHSSSASIGNQWFYNSNTGVSVFNPATLKIFFNGVDISTKGGIVSTRASVTSGEFDLIDVDLTSFTDPHNLNSSATVLLQVDVSSTANGATQNLVPYIVDGGYSSSSDANITVSNGTASSTGSIVGQTHITPAPNEIDGIEFNFASASPPKLLADISIYPTTLTKPYTPQSNVDPQYLAGTFLATPKPQVVMQFDTNVGVLDDPTTSATGSIFLRSNNTKVADLYFDVSSGSGQAQAQVSSNGQTIQSNIYGKLVFNVCDPGNPNQPLSIPLNNDEVYYVTVVAGSYDQLTGKGTGIADLQLNFFGGVNDNSTYYFKTWTSTAPTISNVTSPFNTPSVGTISATFDQYGSAYFLVMPHGAYSTSSFTPAQIKTASVGHVNITNSVQITQLGSPQIFQFAANSFVSGTNYDVFIFTENNAPSPNTKQSGVYYYANLIQTTSAQGFVDPTSSATSLVPTTPLYSICPDSYITLLKPMVIMENVTVGNAFLYRATDQTVNIMLPPGYEFDTKTTPNIVLGPLPTSDFNNIASGAGAGSRIYTSYSSNAVLQMRFNNTGTSGISNYFDIISISGLRVIGKRDPLTGAVPQQGDIVWFYGNDAITANLGNYVPLKLATIGPFVPTAPDFYNDYWKTTNTINPFTSLDPVANGYISKKVNAIPDNYGTQVRLVPDVSTFFTGDYLASTFSGSGVSGDLLTLSAVAKDAPFNIVMDHTDVNGCAYTQSEQYIVYDHIAPISGKLGVTGNINLVANQTFTAGTVQDLVNANFNTNNVSNSTNNPGQANSIVSPGLTANEKASYTLLELQADLPVSELANQSSPSQLISGGDLNAGTGWRPLIKSLPKNSGNVPANWDYSDILNASSAVVNSTTFSAPSFLSSGAFTDVYDYFKQKSTTGSGDYYWTGGSLGKVEFTGIYQNSADNSIYIPFKQNVELFVPAVPLIEVVSPAAIYDANDKSPIFTSGSRQYPNGYPGTAIFCESGGIITLSALPRPTGGISVGQFQLYDYSTYYNSYYNVAATPGTGKMIAQFGSVAITGVGTSFSSELKVGSELYDPNGSLIGRVASIADNTHLTLRSWSTRSSADQVNGDAFTLKNPVTPLSGGTDNLNGTMTIDPALVKNSYNDILVTYTYQDNNSPAIGTGYFVIRVTPNPVAQFTISSAIAAAGATGSSAYNAFCEGNVINFDGTVAQAYMANNQQPTQGSYVNYISNYTWDFGDPTSTANIVTGALPTATSPITTAHAYSSTSTYSIKLSLVSNWGCSSAATNSSPAKQPSSSNVLFNGSQGQITVGEIPTVNFAFTGNCVTDPMIFTDASIMAKALSTSGNPGKFVWDFGDNTTAFTGFDVSPAASTVPTFQYFTYPVTPDGQTNVQHVYAAPKFYNVSLTTITDLGCQATAIKSIAQLPLQSPSQGSAYEEYFSSDPSGSNKYGGGWLPLNIDNTYQPNLPAPAFPTNQGAISWTWDGDKWTIPSYGKDEKSALYSACLDLSSIPRPVIQYHGFVDFNVGSGEGVVLQYSKDIKNIQDPTKDWEVLGTTPDANNASPGLEWYNKAGLSGNPGTGFQNSNNASGFGWADQIGYDQPKHKLEDVTTNTGANNRVILRFAFASQTAKSTVSFRLDSVRVGSRTRTILLENFTSTNPGSSLNSDVKADADAIALFTANNISSTQLVDIIYHVGFMGPDPFSIENPADPSGRALYYGVNKVPYAFFDGKHSQSASGSDLFKDWGQGAYDLQTLELAKADFLDPAKLTTVIPNSDNTFTIDVNVTPKIDLPLGDKKGTILNIAILERLVQNSTTQMPQNNGQVTTGETQFEYVLRKMLPDASGTKIPTSLGAGSPAVLKSGVNVSLGKFTYIPSGLHGSKFVVVLFLQNEDTKEVYQSDLFNDLDIPNTTVTAIEPLTEENIQVYPNPSDREFTIELPQAAKQKTSILMVDQLGRFIEAGEFQEGEQKKTVSTQGLSDGMYILQVGDNDNAARKKVMVIHK